MRFDVFGICSALFDIQATVPDAVLERLGVQKGAMFLVDEEQQARVVAELGDAVVNTEAGGSGANTMSGVALLGGRACFTSRVGEDDFGRRYRASLESRGVHLNLGLGGGATGVVVVLVTPDAQRTMLTCLGQSRHLQPEDIVVEDVAASRIVYITGYLWDADCQKAAVELAMREAKRAGRQVAFSLSDRFCVERNRADFERLLDEYVDIVFANADEGCALTGASTAAEAARALGDHCGIAAVTDGAHGSVVRADGVSVSIPPFPVDLVDTTGAGDMYAAGLLHGLVRSLPIEAAGRIASYCSAQVVARMGPRIETVDAAEIARLSAA